ncbi:MAG: ankyrin repeat domain-containing protein [Armatimonadetes bacterium]|nr:ankyrin repeat domain-containing protein [Armatimonadota bacterium]
MEAVFPQAMFLTRRAVCPGCGVPMELALAQPMSTCDYCGRTSVVERRLRTGEPEAPRPRRTVKLDWLPSHLEGGRLTEELSCWGCGHPLEPPTLASLVRCPMCGSETRVERRMRLIPVEVETSADEDAGTASLVESLAGGSLADRILRAAEAFDGWHHVNLTLARRCHRLMEIMQRDDPRLAFALGEGLGKLVCHEDARFADAVLLAAEAHVFDPAGSQALLQAIGLGPGRGLKLLLDAADVLGRRGASSLACTALLAANTLIGRNFGERARLAEIILYRLPYVSGPLLAWTLACLRGEHPLMYRYPVDTLLRFLDDCAAERPQLVAEIVRGLGCDPLPDETEYRARLELSSQLLSTVAREWFWRSLPPPPPGASLRLVSAAAGLAIPLLEDGALAEAASGALTRLFERTIPAEIHRLVKARGDSLPESLRRGYLERVPSSPQLSPLPPRCWEPPTPAPRHPEALEAERLLEAGLRLALEQERADRNALADYREILRGRTPLMAAAMEGDVPGAGRLLQRGADIDESNPEGWTALMFAAAHGQGAAVVELLARGASIHPRDRRGRTALVLSAEAGVAEVLRLLPSTPEQRQEALLAALRGDRTESAKALLELGADPDLLDEEGRTPLMTCRQPALLQLLVLAGAQLDHQDRRGRTALMHAAASGEAAVVDLLLQSGADPHFADFSGETPLSLARRAGHEDLARRLEEAGGP